MLEASVRLQNQRLGPSHPQTVTATATLKRWQSPFENPSLHGLASIGRNRTYPEQSPLSVKIMGRLVTLSELLRPHESSRPLTLTVMSLFSISREIVWTLFFSANICYLFFLIISVCQDVM